MTPTVRVAACLGVLAGIATATTATVARADIPITGGQVTGEAAFFSPTNVPSTSVPSLTRSGAPVLFDTAIQTLRIDTPNGTTTTSRFLPNASRFTDVNGNSRADAGDRGRLEGALSGVAFNRAGSPVFFQNIPTALNFTLTSFNPVSLDAGSLINPRQEGTAPLVFLPGVNVTLSASSSATFNSQFGLLEAGLFAANLTGDFIGLPSDLQLRPATTEVTLVPIVLGRRIKFDFEGKSARSEDSFFLTNAETGRRVLSFLGDVTDFQIQSVGTPGTREFSVRGSGSLGITLGDPFDIKQNSLDLNSVAVGSQLDYRIKGEGPGYVAFTGSNSIAYSGTSRRATEFKFEQGGRSFEGRSDGRVSFVVNDRRDNIDFDAFSVPVVGFTTTTVTGAPFIITTPGTTSISVTSSSTSTFVFSTTVFNTNSITIFPAYQNVLLETGNDDDDNDDDDDDDDDDDNRVAGRGDDDDDDDNDDDDDDDNRTARRYGNNRTYYVYTQRREATEVVIERQGDRILVVDRTETRGRKLKKRGQVVSAYQVVGLPSRVFPGLVGLRQLPPEQVQSANEAEMETAEDTESSPEVATVEPAAQSPTSSESVGDSNAVSQPTTTSSATGTNPAN